MGGAARARRDPLFVARGSSPGTAEIAMALSLASLSIAMGPWPIPGRAMPNLVNPDGVPVLPTQFYAEVSGKTVGNVTGIPMGAFHFKQWYDYDNLRQRIDRDDGSTKMYDYVSQRPARAIAEPNIHQVVIYFLI